MSTMPPDYFSAGEAPDRVKDEFKCFFHISYRINGKLYSFPLCHDNPHVPALQAKAKEIADIMSKNRIICGTRNKAEYDVIIFPDMGE